MSTRVTPASSEMTNANKRFTAPPGLSAYVAAIERRQKPALQMAGLSMPLRQESDGSVQRTATAVQLGVLWQSAQALRALDAGTPS